MSEHPSFFELDTYALARTGSPELIRHTASCEQCSAHLAGLRQPEHLPDWARALPPPRRRFTLPRWLIPMGTLAVAMGLLVLVVPGVAPDATEHAPDAPYVATKGAPEARILIKRGEQISIWTSSERIAPGDRLRVELHPSGYAHFALVSPEAGGFSVLAQGALRADPELIPGAWEVDGSPRDEVMLVVLSRELLSKAQLEEAVATQPRTDAVWTLERRLRKQVRP